MIVFVDAEKETIKYYTDNGCESFEFDEVDDLVEKIGKKSVQWVTSVCPATGKQIAETINALVNSRRSAGIQSFDDMDRAQHFLQSQKAGIVHVQDIGVTFEGPGDCKLLDEEMYQNIENSPVLRALLKKETIKIVDYATMRRSARKQQRNKAKFQHLRQKSKDKDLDSIIVKDSRAGSAEMLAAGMFDGDDESGSTDITDSIINDPTEKMSEAEYAEALRNGSIAP